MTDHATAEPAEGPAVPRGMGEGRSKSTLTYVVLACAITWALAMPTALAWWRHAVPPAYAMPCAGLSAFGPLFAALIAVGKRRTLFRPFLAHPGWIALALFTPMAMHLIATLLFVAIGGKPEAWFHPPAAPERWAALVVFPLGEEFGWRGFAHPRLAARFGLVKGSLLLGLAWGVWHLAYSVPPTGGFDGLGFAMGMVELPLYSLLMAWVFERTGRAMAVAIAFHAGAHLDHLELASRADLRLHGLHLLVVGVVAAFAARSLARRPQPMPS